MLCYKAVATIPKLLQEHINSAFPVNVCLIATALPSGFAQVTPRGSLMVFDDDHFAFWERGKGTTNANLKDGTKVTVFFRKPELRQPGVLPKGGIARFYGVAELHKTGAIRDQIWERVIQVEKDRDPEKKGFGVLVKVERAEDLAGDPLNL
jgi:Pyridoxamine 5'-phosphate oxidase